METIVEDIRMGGRFSLPGRKGVFIKTSVFTSGGRSLGHGFYDESNKSVTLLSDDDRRLEATPQD